MSDAERAGPRGNGIDHAERAKKRMAEIRAMMGEDNEDAAFEDRFYAEAPPGWVYEWKLFSAFNKEYPQYLARMARNGWSPVEATRHKHLLFDGYMEETIIVDGLILMERPKELSDRRRIKEKEEAEALVRAKELAIMDTPSGQPPRGTHPFTRPILSSSVGPAQIPD